MGSFVALLVFLFNLTPEPGFNSLDAAFWLVLLLMAQRSEIRLPVQASMSHLFVVALAAVVIFPAWLAAVMVFAGYFNKDFGQASYSWYKDLFNRAQHGLATGAAALVWWLVQAQPGLNPYLLDFGGIFAASVVYFVVNVSSVSYGIKLLYGVSIRKVWFENYGWLWASYLVQAPVGLLLAKAYQVPLVGGWGGFTVLLMMLLLYFSRYYWDEKVKLEESFDNTIEVLVSALDAKDPFTRLHSERVASIANSVAQKMGLDEQDQKRITYAARIHDIGKVAIPDSVLLNPGKLTSEQFDLIKSHPAKGLELLHPMRQRLSKDVQGVIRNHHERWDGTGYPDGLKAEAIPQWARVVTLADAYEAMTAGRAYAKAKSPEEALNEIIMHAGKQFDPHVVRLFEAAWLEDLIWKDREEFLRRYTSPVPLSGLSATSPLSNSRPSAR
jgi:hypothetical protein